MGGVPIPKPIGSTEELTILILGTDPLGKRLASALQEHGHDVEVSKRENAVDMVTITAPDIVILVGDAALNGGKKTLQRLADHDSAWVTPVVVIGSGSDDTNANYCRGAIAFLSRTLGAKRLAERVYELAVGLPERTGEVSGEVPFEKIVALIENLSDKRRSGVLSVDVEGETETASLVLRAGIPISEDTGEFVARIKSKLSGKKSVSYRFSESSSGRVDSLSPPEPEDKQSLPVLKDRRLLIVDSKRGRANALATALQLAGSQVIVLTPQTTDFASASQLDPEVVLISPQDLTGLCKGVMATIQQGRRTRWAAKLLAPVDEVWPNGAKQPHLGPIAARIAKLIKPADFLASHLQSNRRFDTRLEILGPGRMLRILADSNRNLRVTLHHPRLSVEMELINGRIHTVKGLDRINNIILDSTSALSALLVVNSGRIQVEHTEPNLRLLNMDIGDAFTEAAAEQPPIRPSLIAVPKQKKLELLQSKEAKKNDCKASELQRLSPFTPSVNDEPPLPTSQAALNAPESAVLAPEPIETIFEMEPIFSISERTSTPNARKFGERAFEAAKATPKEQNISGIESLDDGKKATPVQLQSITDLIDEVVDLEPENHADIEMRGEESIDIIESIPMRALSPGPFFKGLLKSVGIGFSRTRAFAAGPALNWLKTSTNAVLFRTRGFAVVPAFGKVRESVGVVPAFGKVRESVGVVYDRVRVLVVDKLPGSSRQKTIVAGIVGAFLVLLLVVPAFLNDDEAEASVTPKKETEVKTAPTVVSTKTKEPEPIAIKQPSTAEPRVNRNGFVSKGEESGDEVLEVPQPEEPNDNIGEKELANTNVRKSDEVSSLEKARIMVNNALRLRRQNRLGMAETYYLKALKIRPIYPRAMVGIVRIHLERKDGAEALRWAKRVVALQPNSSYNRLLLGDAYAATGNKKRARKAWELAARRGNKRAQKRLSGR